MSGYIPRPPHENGELLERFARMCADDGRIVAGFLMGSLARGEADEFSDVDLGVIATAEAYDDVRGDRARIVESLGEPLFLEDFGNDANIHFILADGTEGELFVARVDRMSDLHLGDYRVLVGDAGIAPTGTLPFADPDHETLADELDRLVRWFWHDLSHFTAAVGRSQPWWAAGQLEALRAACVNLARLAQGRRGPGRGVREARHGDRHGGAGSAPLDVRTPRGPRDVGRRRRAGRVLSDASAGRRRRVRRALSRPVGQDRVGAHG
jgi:predicted nucleotidyltransferase